MRLVHKYKIYNKVRNVLSYPTRILKFKRTKWLRIKKFLQKKQRKKRYRYRYRIVFSNRNLVKLNLKRWSRMKYVYKNLILNNRLSLIKMNLDKRKVKYFKNFSISKKKDDTYKKFYKQISSSDYLLTLVKFSSNIFSSKQLMRSKKIFVNGKLAKKPSFLKKGDFVVLKDNFFFYKLINLKYSKMHRFNTLLDVDYYSQSFVLLKSENDVTNRDFYTITGA